MGRHSEENTVREEARQTAQAARCAQLVRVVGASTFLTVLNITILLSARAKVISGLVHGSTQRTARWLGLMTSAGALLEFFTNPVIGRLSDACGRRPCMHFASALAVVCRLGVYTRPTLPVVFLDRVLTSAADTGFFTVWRAALADLVTSAEFSMNVAKVGMCAGLGLVTGPIAGHIVLTRGGKPGHCFLAAAGISAANHLLLRSRFEETLPPEEQHAFSWRNAHPLSFIKLLNSSPTVARLMSVTWIQTLTEARNLGDVNYLYLEEDLKWTPAQVTRYQASFGVALIAGGAYVKKSINALGLRGHTSMSNFFNAIAYMQYCFAPHQPWSTQVAMYIALVLSIPGARKRDAVESLIVTEGAQRGFGRGFVSACMMNWRATSNVVAPLIFSSIYARFNKRMPSAPFGAAAVSVACAQALFLTCPA